EFQKISKLASPIHHLLQTLKFTWFVLRTLVLRAK
ncbi:unnamed protein product, partial [marine sediment metagenome]